jgi:hypothetical protein
MPLRATEECLEKVPTLNIVIQVMGKQTRRLVWIYIGSAPFSEMRHDLPQRLFASYKVSCTTPINEIHVTVCLPQTGYYLGTLSRPESR